MHRNCAEHGLAARRDARRSGISFTLGGHRLKGVWCCLHTLQEAAAVAPPPRPVFNPADLFRISAPSAAEPAAVKPEPKAAVKPEPSAASDVPTGTTAAVAASSSSDAQKLSVKERLLQAVQQQRAGGSGAAATASGTAAAPLKKPSAQKLPSATRHRIESGSGVRNMHLAFCFVVVFCFEFMSTCQQCTLYTGGPIGCKARA